MLASACNEAAPSERRAPARIERYFLGQDFAFEQARCQVASAQELLTEIDALPDLQRVSSDVRVLWVKLRCYSAAGLAVAPARAVPAGAAPSLELTGVAPIVPSLRTKLGHEGEGSYVFPLPRPGVAVQPAQRYDARTGEAKDRLGAVATFVLRDGARELRVQLARSFDTPALAARLDALAVALSTASSTLPPALTALHARVMEGFAPRSLALSAVAVEADQARVRVRYERVTKLLAEPRSLELELVVPLSGASTVRHDELALAELARHVGCAQEASRLHMRSAAVARQAPLPCNVAGELLPQSCDAVEPGLRADLLSHAERCAEPALSRGASGVPDDFQVTLRRGRRGSALDREPRYTLSLFANGVVVFHGTHWVTSRERLDGRAAPRFLAELWAQVTELNFFERRGGDWDAERCGLDRDDGHVLTVHGAGRERMVLEREGCRGPFSASELEALMTLAERSAFVTAWTTARASQADGDADAEVWTVTAD